MLLTTEPSLRPLMGTLYGLNAGLCATYDLSSSCKHVWDVSGLSGLRGCDRELHPGGVGSAGHVPEEPLQRSGWGNLYELGLYGGKMGPEY